MKQTAIFRIIATMALTAWTAAAESSSCENGACPLRPDATPEISVYSPVSASAVAPIPQGPRLKTFTGKTIALVGGSFMASVTHPELKRLIRSEFPTAKVFLLSEIGSAGPYPRPGVVRREKDEFQRRLKEFKVDAIIAGNGGCGLCTPKDWNRLMAERGYAPLESFKLKSDLKPDVPRPKVRGYARPGVRGDYGGRPRTRRRRDVP